jgi:hypothetical protein
MLPYTEKAKNTRKIMTTEEFLDELKNLPPEFVLKQSVSLIRFKIPNKGLYHICPICAVCLHKIGMIYNNWEVDFAARHLNLKNDDTKYIIISSDGIESELNNQMREIVNKRTTKAL